MSAICKRASAFLLLAGLLVSLLPGCTRLSRYSMTYTDVFDTVTTVTAYADSRDSFQQLAGLLHGELTDCHRLFDIYHEYEGVTNLCTLNRTAGSGPVCVDSRILDLLELALAVGTASDGKLNVCMGSVLKLWEECRNAALTEPAQAALPDAIVLAEASKHIHTDSLCIDREAGTVEILDPLTSLDVGAVAKGFAAETACRRAEAAGYTGFLLSAGGNVCTVGTKPDGSLWKVGLEDPAGQSEIALLQLADCSAVTSGGSKRCYTVNGSVYHHLIDPDSTYPADLYESVTVVCRDSALADALSTALFFLSQESGIGLAARYSAEVFWLYPDGHTAYTPGFSAYFA